MFYFLIAKCNKVIVHLDRLLDFSLAGASASSIISPGELDLLSCASGSATGLLDLEEALPDLDLDFLLFGLALAADFDRDLLLAVCDFGLCDRDLGDCDRDFGLCDLDLGDWDRDLGLCGPDFGLAERLLGVPERDLALAEPERDLLEPLLDLEVLCLGLPETLDLGLDDPDLLLCAEPERDLLE